MPKWTDCSYNASLLRNGTECRFGTLNDQQTMAVISGSGYLIYFGCFAATLSSAIASLVGRIYYLVGILRTRSNTARKQSAFRLKIGYQYRKPGTLAIQLSYSCITYTVPVPTGWLSSTTVPHLMTRYQGSRLSYRQISSSVVDPNTLNLDPVRIQDFGPI